MKWFSFIFLLLGPLSGCGFSANQSSQDNLTIDVPMSSLAFTVAYDGGGFVSLSGSSMTMQPMVSASNNETHAALVLLKQTQEAPVRDFELVLDVQVVRQLRQNSAPNPWEVFWLFFSYNSDNAGTKTTNYFLSKPQVGAELGLAFNQVGQTFLSNDAVAATTIGERHIFKYRRVNNAFTVYRDGVFFYSYVDSDSTRLYFQKGALGLYTEDAQVQIFSVQYTNLDNIL